MAPFPVFIDRSPEKKESWSWGCAKKEKHKVGVIEAELRKLMKSGLNGVRVFHTLYHCRVMPLAERTHPMWMYGARSDPDHVSPDELPDNEIWSRISRVLQLRPRETIVGKPIPFNASIMPTLVCSLFCSCSFSFPFL